MDWFLYDRALPHERVKIPIKVIARCRERTLESTPFFIIWPSDEGIKTNYENIKTA